ncbi:NarK family nitrate/nitrite MFS transporter [Dermatobacter hominis]|uniref:NarK family nitrate/nitrite MFS transporter n=1 Tax=Dermatobacter hominis TaxID=2884263 RepID=UPI001D10BE44|nr:NarK family nitrate/nitrite MFS transporter [Dermatobacter hominis]UDY35153.1 NarK family nitrate/nitrite MFS transporter [Dermatobacter hominis]
MTPPAVDHPPTRPTTGSLIASMFRRGPAQRVLHLTWFAFFLTFVAWFNFAPFATTIGGQFDLSTGQLVTLGLCNLALTVPARLVVGSLLDRFGPRRTFSAILLYATVPCLLFATAQSFEVLVLSRLLMGVVGAGFVVGIRMVAEWFPPAEVGTAEGIYGGWGNFGAAAAALTLPAVAGAVGGPAGWRWAVAGTGVVAGLYGLAYLRLVRDTPDGTPYARARRAAALEVTSRGAVWGLIAMSVPLAGALVVIAWRIFHVGVISAGALGVAVAASLVLLALQVTSVWRVNERARTSTYPSGQRYPFRSVAVLSFAYACTFGSELAAVSFLPEFFETTWGLSAAVAGAAAAAFAVMNLVSRPGGGLLSDLVASRRRWLSVLLGGLGVGYLVLSQLSSAWPLWLALVAVLVTSVFAQAGNGAVYAIVPLVRRQASGQVSGLCGAYGNVGGIVFLTVLVVSSARTAFLVMGVASLCAFVASRWLVEPSASHAAAPSPEPDGAAVSEDPVVAGPVPVGAAVGR